jgi:hypothetical protein
MLIIPAYSQDAYEIIRKANDLMRGESSSGMISIEKAKRLIMYFISTVFLNKRILYFIHGH